MLDTKQRLLPETQLRSDAKPKRRLDMVHGILAVLIAAPAVLMFWFVMHYGVNLPYMDEWNFAALAVKSASGQMQFIDLIKAQNNEHMLAVPYALMLGISSLTKYNSVALMIASAVILLVANALWCYIGWRFLATKCGTTKTLLALIPVSLLMCSVRQYENLLWGFQVQITLLMLLAMVTAVLLDRAKKVDLTFGLSTVTAIMCTYSFANGLFIWPTGVFLMLLKRRNSEFESRQSRNAMMAIWIAVGATTVASYFLLREVTSWTNSQHSSVQLLLHRPKVLIFYVLTMLGNPLAFTRETAITSGSVMMILAATVLPSCADLLRRFKLTPVILSILFFSAMACLVVCAGRAGSAYGIDQALVSRYCTMITPGIIGLYLLCVASADAFRPWSRLRMVLVTLLVLAGVANTIGDSFKQASEMQASRLALIDVVHNYRTQGESNLSMLAPDINQVRQISAGLERHKLSSFSR